MSQSTSLPGGARLTQAVIHALREGLAIFLAVLGIVLLLALASYTATDPGWSYSGDSEEVGNLIGRFGAVLADVLLFLFGRPAYLLPAVLLIAAWLVFRNRVEALRPASRINLAVRQGGFVLLLSASCALATLHWDAGTLRQTAGGVLGQAIGHSLQSGLRMLGAR